MHSEAVAYEYGGAKLGYDFHETVATKQTYWLWLGTLTNTKFKPIRL